MRFFCWGKVVEWNDEPRFGEMVTKMGKNRVSGARAVIELQIWKVSRHYCLICSCYVWAVATAQENLTDDLRAQVQTSCGFGVPYLPSPTYEDIKAIETGEKKYLELIDRQTMGHWASKQIEKGALRDYQKMNNAFSLDKLPGLRTALRDAGYTVWVSKITAWVRKVGRGQKEGFALGVVVGCFLLLLTQAFALA